ncbi:MAG: phytanoyl-CoA dioxygenase family protein [Pseudomonadales bacterium]|nr:phytanoyl-CoA dioxygenase family protein [Pseudomonadales bacterium]
MSIQTDETSGQITKAMIDEMGWVGVDPDAPDIRQLREYLEANNGITGLETVSPDDPDRAVELFYRDGFVAVENALTPEQLAFLQAGVHREIHKVLTLDETRSGNRGSHRYSFGGSSKTGHLMHLPEWAMLIDLPTMTPILQKIFGSRHYHARGGGGDFCMPGAAGYQPLHSDLRPRKVETFGNGVQQSYGTFYDPTGSVNFRSLPVPMLTLNFITVDSTRINGSIRQIPGTQHTLVPIPKLSEEPEWMKLSCVCPARAGAVLIRDVRAWHGGTPNVSMEARAIPNVEFYAPWYIEPQPRSMPRAIYETLSDYGKYLCRYIVADSNDDPDTGYASSNLGFDPFERLY